jgi:F-type H+-transporting ATPase subunit a
MTPVAMPIPGLAATLEPPESAITTWCLIAVLLLVCWILQRRLNEEGVSRFQNVFEMFMEQLCSLIREIVNSDPVPYVPFVGTLFIYVFTANLVGMVPGLSSPTSDLSVTAGLAVLVFLSVPFFGIRARGFRSYLQSYLRPNPFLLPFNLLGEITRTLALAVRLFGNIMSGEFLFLVVVGVVTTVLRGYSVVFMPAGYILTLFLSILSLITAAIQAYIFTVLALVYVGSAVQREFGGEDDAERESDIADADDAGDRDQQETV